MKWFKHMATANRDEKIARLIDDGGFEAYGFYWFVLETIAEQMDSSDRTWVEFPISHWRRITGFMAPKLRKMLGSCERVGLLLVISSDTDIKVDCPNLLKIRDDYSKKSGQAPEQEVEEEVEEDNKEKNTKKEKSDPEGFDEFWELFPRQRKGNAKKGKAAYRQALERGATAGEIISAVRVYATCREVRDGYAAGAARWLNDDGWTKDYSDVPPPSSRPAATGRVQL